MSPEALRALARAVEDGWGYDGYRFEQVKPVGFTGSAIAEVAHFDGSRFWVGSDRWGNAVHGDTDQEVLALLRGESAQAAVRA